MDRGTLPAGPQDMAVDVTHRFPRWFPLSFSLSFPLWPLALAGAATMFLGSRSGSGGSRHFPDRISRAVGPDRIGLAKPS
jgi:hypothetical protein